MLPSTGYFKAINCPFYDSGLCERPYCHFRHAKKDSQSVANDGMESGTILQQLVSEAVKKVLSQNAAGANRPPQYSTSGAGKSAGYVNNSMPVVSKPAYNPTPISELNKINNTDSDNVDENSDQRRRHIPVPYTPRKPANFPIKRPADINGSSKPFIYIPPEAKYTPGSTVKLDPYTPEGSVESKEKYLPGSEKELQEYTVEETKSSTSTNYIPSDKNVKKNILEYKPTKVSTKSNVPSVTYHPTPLSQVPCFSSDEDEPVAKRKKVSNELNALDNLDTEFEMLGEILDEEKSKEELKENKQDPRKVKKSDNSIKSKTDSTKSNDKKSANKSASDKSVSASDNDKRDSKTISKEQKSSRSLDKESSRSKSKSKDSDSSNSKKSIKEKSNHKHEDNSKSSHKSSKSSESSTSKHSGKGSKHSDRKEKSSSKSSSEKHEKKKDRDKHDKHRKSSKDKHSSKKKKKSKSDELSDGVDCEDDLNVQNNSDNDADELIYEISEDEESIALECKKIFEEYIPTMKSLDTKQAASKVDIPEDEGYVPTKKRVSRTIDKEIKVIPRAPIKPDFKVNAAQAMAERLAKVREFHALKVTSPPPEPPKPEPPKVTPNTPSTSSKIRIAHVPYAATLVNAKKTIQPTLTKSTPSTSTTIVQTIAKGVQRVAHVPNEKFIDRPGVLEPLASKIPANIRSTYLNMMIDQCLKIYLTAPDAYARAQHEELATSKKCTSSQIYKNSAILSISRLKKEIQECNGIRKCASDCSTLQKLPQFDSDKHSGTWSIQSKNRKTSVDEFRGSRLYENIQKWVLTEEQLQENGFPRPHPSGENGRAAIYAENYRNKQNPPKGNLRTCCRCKKEYTVNKKNFPSVKEECIYHPNNKYRFRGEVKYQCCSQDGTSDGCCIAPSHVYEYVDYENLRGYVKTMYQDKQLDDYGVYALDCEMCYTTHGLDLTRVTVIDSTCRTVYETLIKPLHPIIDYNTRYSGITEEQMADVTTTLLDVQATLLTMFSSKTILIGHSLESDFKALKLIHDTVIDTSVLYPHKMGPPYKRALRNLSSEYLRKIIQNSVDGHDSAEDATVCMELIHYKLKEDLKTR